MRRYAAPINKKASGAEAFSGSGKRDSNPRHPAWEAGALPTELFPHALPRGDDLALRSGLVNEYIWAPDAASSPVILPRVRELTGFSSTQVLR